MTRFETLDGQQLGVTFFGGKEHGKVKFLTQSELETLWSLDESTEVLNDNNSTVSNVGELLDLFSGLKQLSDDQMRERGWGDRLESGLHLRVEVSNEGRLKWVR